MTQNRSFMSAATVCAGLAALTIAQAACREGAPVIAEAQSGVQAPRFEVDLMWPKPLPDNQILGATIGVAVDERDHVWVMHRGSASLNTIEKAGESNAAECCKAAPPILEFDPAGKLVSSFGGPGDGYNWPQSLHGLTIDSKGHIWFGTNGQIDGHFLRFTKQGKFVKQYGFQNANATNSHTSAFGQVSKAFLDEKSNEVYVADGESNGKTSRVVVVDPDTGKFKRMWGAYGNKPFEGDPGPYDPSAPLSQKFSRAVHCIVMSNDRLLYVCDRENNRMQVFTPEGKYLKEVIIAKNTKGVGVPADIAFSTDPEQKYMYLSDGQNQKVYVIDRQSLEVLTSFGAGGRQPGQFMSAHSLAVDSKGNVYVTDTIEGKRVQRFNYKGIAPVTTKDQGTVWPASAASTSR